MLQPESSRRLHARKVGGKFLIHEAKKLIYYSVPTAIRASRNRTARYLKSTAQKLFFTFCVLINEREKKQEGKARNFSFASGTNRMNNFFPLASLMHFSAFYYCGSESSFQKPIFIQAIGKSSLSLVSF